MLHRNPAARSCPANKSHGSKFDRRLQPFGCGAPRLFYVERFGALGLAGGVEGDLFDPCLRLAQQLLAAALESFAPLIDRDRFFERHLAFFEPLDDRLEFLDRAFETQGFDIGVLVSHGLCKSFHPRISAVTWAAADWARPWRS